MDDRTIIEMILDCFKELCLIILCLIVIVSCVIVLYMSKQKNEVRIVPVESANEFIYRV